MLIFETKMKGQDRGY